MTREERELSIEYLEKIKEDYIEGNAYERHPLPEYYAIENAIKALEQEPCEDAVSRKAVHDMLENLPVTVENKWFNWLQKACIRLAELPPVTPQEQFKPMVEIDLYSVIKQSYIEREVLDKIRAEIEGKVLESLSDGGDDWFTAEKVNECLDIIDKYKAESEE